MTNMTKRVSAANAKAHLSALVAEVAFGGQQVVIERRGKPMAVLVGLDHKVLNTDKRNESPGEARGALALVGVWRSLEDSEAAGVLDDIHAQRGNERNWTGDASGGNA